MAILSLIFGEGPKLKIAELDIDVSENETHEFGAQITENPIEQGAKPTDNVSVTPPTLTVNGIVSDTPIRFLSGIRSLFGDSAVQAAFAELRRILETKEPITVATGLEVYENMVLQGFRVPRDRTTGTVMRFQAVFKQVRIISTSLVALPAQFGAVQDFGKQTAGSASDAAQQEAANPASLLSRITGFAG